MIVSDEQRLAAMGGPRLEEYSWIDLPEGRQPLPSWALDLHIEWMPQYINPPRLRLTAGGRLRSWEHKVYAHHRGRYMAEHPDGRAEVYYHHGAVAMRELERWNMAEKKHEKYQALATDQQEGFGGDNYAIRMVTGETIVLRGPWHGGSPAGFIEVAYVDVTDEWHKRISRDRPWHATGGMGGLYLREEVFIRIFARYMPHCRLARFSDGIEAVHPNWPQPKRFLTQAERDAI